MNALCKSTPKGTIWRFHSPASSGITPLRHNIADAGSCSLLYGAANEHENHI